MHYDGETAEKQKGRERREDHQVPGIATQQKEKRGCRIKIPLKTRPGSPKGLPGQCFHSII